MRAKVGSYVTSQVRRMEGVEGIKITPTNRVFRFGQISLKEDIPSTEYDDFLKYLSEELCDQFKEAIDKQKYATASRGGKVWKPLSVRYLDYKKKHNLSLNIWEATGTLVNAIKVYKKGNLICVGFRDTDCYPKSSLKINLVAKWMEYGGKGMTRPPARPLFRPIADNVSKDIDFYYKKYLKMVKSKNGKLLYAK